MRRIFAFVLFLFSGQAFAQTDPIVSITINLPPNPDARTHSWGSGTGMFSISAVARTVNGRIDPRVEGSKILVVIKKAGSVVCGIFNSNNAPAANFSTLNKVWNGSNAVSLIGQECTLPPGEYELSVQFFGAGPAGTMPLSEEKRKSFSIKEVEQQNYQAPQPISPANGSLLTEADLKKPITFRWTPVIPRPRDGVTYRVRVWQLMEGQNGPQAIIQQPILGNEVGNITQVIVRLKTPPPNQNGTEVYVWNVQALDRDGKPIGGNNGTSELFTITVQPVNAEPASQRISLVSPFNGGSIPLGERPEFKWVIRNENNHSPGSGQLYKIKIVEIKGDQSPEQAFKGNKPFFEKDSLRAMTFQYPSSAPKLEKGKRYAWKILSCEECTDEPVMQGENNRVSEPFAFRVDSKAERKSND